jgi:hypothetical protein
MPSVLAQRIASFVLLAALFVLPLYPKIGLVSVSGTYIPVRFDDLIIALAAVVWIAALMAARRLPRAPRRLTTVATIWLGVTFISFIVGAFVLQSIGVLIGLAYWAKPVEYLLLGLIAYDLVRNEWLPIRSLLITVLASATIVIVYGIGEHFGWLPHLPGLNPPPGGVISTMGDYHELASYLGLIILLLVVLFQHAATRVLRSAAVLLAFGAILVLFWTGNRSEYIALFVVLFGLVLWRPTRRPAAVALLTMVLVFVSPLVLFVAAYLNAPPGQASNPAAYPEGPWYSVTVRFAGAPLAYSLGERFLLKWPRFIESAMHSPIIGLGPSSAGEAVDGYYLRSFVESGILGLLAFIALLVATFISAWRGARQSIGVAKSLAVVAVSATAFVGLVGVLIDSWVASRVMDLYWPLIGIALAAVAVQRETEMPSTVLVAGQAKAAGSA